jgi:O-antigen/teichoic acid export membrane protein
VTPAALKRAALIAYRAGSDVAGKVALFVVTVVAARRLSQQAFGIFSIASVFGWMVGLATDFGIPLHVARAVAQRPRQAPEILRRWLNVRLATSAVVTALIVVGVLAARSRAQAIPILFFALAYVLSALIDFLHYFYRGVGRSDIESTLTLWQRSTMVGAALLALWWTTDLTVLATATLLPVVVTFAFSVWFARRLAGQAARRSGTAPAGALPMSLRAEFWRDVFPIGAGILLSALYFRVDVFLVERWRGAEAVALYNAAFRLLEAVRLFPAAVMAVVLPVFCQATDARPFGRVSVVLVLFGVVAAGAGWAAADWLVPLVYGGSYAGAAGAFRILMWSFPLMSLNYALTHQLIGWHGQRAYATVCALALGFNVALNVWLVPARSIEGAAWATVWTEVLVTAGCAWGLRRRMVARPFDSHAAAQPDRLTTTG